MLNKIFQSRSFIFVLLVSSFILGVAAASLAGLGRPQLFEIYSAIVILAVILAFVWYSPSVNSRIMALAAIFLLLGVLRFVISEPSVRPENLIYYHDRGVEIQGTVAEEPTAQGKQTVVIKSEYVKILNSRESNHGAGRAIAYLDLYPQYHYGDQVIIRCDLVKPESKDNSNYDKYLARRKIWSVCLNTKVVHVQAGHGNYFYWMLYQSKNFFSDRISRILPEPHASFLAGLLYGARGSIPQDLMADFNRTGTSHIVAISGYNITIIAGVLLILLQNLLIPRKKAFWIAVAVIFLFVIFTGASSSVVRAGIMGVIVLMAKQIGRLSQISRVLVATVFLMVLINPRVMFFDVGFQLSFVSTLGLVYISPLLEKLFASQPALLGVKDSLLTTLSAIIATTPLILYQFGRFSLAAPAVNLLVLPIIPLTMAMGFGALILSIIWLPIGQIAGWLVWIPLSYTIKIVEWFSALGWAAVDMPKMNWVILAIIYVILIIVTYKLQRLKDFKIDS